MVELVETMMKLHKDLPKAKTPMTADSLRLTACGLGRIPSQKQSEPLAVSRKPMVVPALAYELYGLTEGEIGIVEGVNT